MDLHLLNPAASERKLWCTRVCVALFCEIWNKFQQIIIIIIIIINIIIIIIVGIIYRIYLEIKIPV